jgi:hypothetical protein
VHKKHLIAISEGTRIDGVKVVPDSVEPLDAQPDTKRTRLKIVVIALSSMPHSIVFDVCFLQPLHAVHLCIIYWQLDFISLANLAIIFSLCTLCHVDCEYLMRSSILWLAHMLD